MLFKSLIAFGAVAATVLAKPIADSNERAFELARRQIPVLACSTGVHVIAASGDGVNNIGGYGLLGQLATKVLHSIPGSTNVTLPYPKGNPDTNQKVTGGVNNMYLYLKEYHAHCPATRIALMGYSAGGMIVMNTLCGASSGSIWTPTGPLASNWTSAVIGATAYGEETHAAGQPYNRGTCKNSAPNWPRKDVQNCAAWSSRIRSWCNANDGECCQGGLIPTSHFTYDNYDDAQAVNFFIAQYKATGGKNPTTPPPANTPPTTSH